MANNRMYILHAPTGMYFYLAKYYPSTGWYNRAPGSAGDELMRFFDACDFGHLNEFQRAQNARHKGFGVPNPAAGGMFGEDYALCYEGDDRLKMLWPPAK